MRAIAYRLLDRFCQLLFWLERPNVFPIFTVSAGALCVVLMLGAYMQRGGLC